jgi:hypothetical protein
MNRNDFVWQLNPADDEAKRNGWVNQVDTKVKGAFGQL